VRDALATRGFVAASAEVTMQPATTVALKGKEAETMLSLAEALEDLDDVQNLHSNFDVSEEEMAKRA
jgi:transcriptional/translational regulatory protein YebC/TACO1